MVEFRVIPHTNNKYECSKCGMVRRVKGRIKNSPLGGTRSVGGKVLSQKIKSNGYREVNLYIKENSSSMRYVHRLVASTWIGAIPSGYNVNHIDGDKSNNSVENLEIVTPSENSAHSYHELGNKIPVFKGEKHAMSKLSTDQVLKIRDQYKRGNSTRDISTDMNIPFSTVCKVAYRQTWKHI